MELIPDGTVPLTVGLVLEDGWYNAHPGEAEFRGGRLVGLRIGHRAVGRSDGGPLTVGLTCFPGLTAGAAAAAPAAQTAGFVRWRVVSRAFAGGELVGEADLGEVGVDVTRLAGG